MRKRERRYKKQEGYTSEILLHYGWDHLVSAKLLFARNPACYDSAGHLAHLGVELILKAVLLEVVGSFPNEHDLVKLFTKVRQYNPAFDLAARHRKTLATISHFVELRYPNPRNPISIGSPQWNRVETLFIALLGAMPERLRLELENRNPTRKGDRVLMKRPKTEWEKRASNKTNGD